MAWAPDYCGPEELRDYVRIPEDDEADDVQLALAVSTASRAVDRCTHRQFGLVDEAEARVYTPRYGRTRGWIVQLDDVQSAADMVVAVDTAGDGTYATVLPAAGYELLPPNARQEGRPWTAMRVRHAVTSTLRGTPGEVRVTAQWGWTEVPGPVVQATLLQASRLLSRRDSPHGIAGSPAAGSEVRLLARVDPDVEVALEPVTRRTWVR